MKNLVVKTLKILPLILGSFGLILPASMSQTHFVIADDLSPIISATTPSNLSASQVINPASNSLDPGGLELLQQIQKIKQPKGFQATNNDLSQVTNVNELRDVEPTAWAYEALKSLVERYGCIGSVLNLWKHI